MRGPLTHETISFIMDNRGPIRSIKFSIDNRILAIQRTEDSVEFVSFVNNEPVVNDMILHKSKLIIA